MREYKPQPFFSAVLNTVMTQLKVKNSDLANHRNNPTIINEDNLSSWRTRNPPWEKNFKPLCDLISSYLSDKHLESMCSKERFITETNVLFSKYSLDEEWDKAKTKNPNYLDMILASLTLGYEYKKIEEEFANSKLVTASPETRRRRTKKLVIFNLDGILIRGIGDSWKILYEAAGIPEETYETNRRYFTEGRISYPELMDLHLGALQIAELTRELLEYTVKDRCSLPQNLHEAIDKLKNAGCTVGIISGSSDAVLKAAIPDADSLFGNNVYVNKMTFDYKEGKLTDIEATPYDWDDEAPHRGVAGKSEGVKKLCKLNVIEPKNTVFVGNSPSDFKAMSTVGSGILDISGIYEGSILGTNTQRCPASMLVSGSDLMNIANLILHETE